MYTWVAEIYCQEQFQRGTEQSITLSINSSPSGVFYRVLGWQVWEIIEKLDAEVFVSGLHPLIADAVNSGLRRSL